MPKTAYFFLAVRKRQVEREKENILITHSTKVVWNDQLFELHHKILEFVSWKDF